MKEKYRCTWVIREGADKSCNACQSEIELLEWYWIYREYKSNGYVSTFRIRICHKCTETKKQAIDKAQVILSVRYL